jgi:hypothetical protein
MEAHATICGILALGKKKSPGSGAIRRKTGKGV